MTTDTYQLRALIAKWRGTHGSGFTSQGEFQAHLSALRTCADELESVLAQQSAAVDGLAARLVDELDGLVGESYGVSGLHLNGDVAPWDELLPGGRFERLSSLDELRAALAAQQQGGAA